MARRSPSIFVVIFSAALCAGDADARSRSSHDANSWAPIADASPTLAPFQHVRFCLRYPSDCKSNPTESERIELNAQTLDLLKHINRSVNMAIVPEQKSYGSDLQDGWTIAPNMGDCN